MERMTEEQRKACQEENEQKKYFLRSYRRAAKKEQRILEKIQKLRMDKMFPSVANDGMPHGSSQSGLDAYIEKLSECQEELKAIQLEKAICKGNIEKLIHNLHDENEQKVLRLHYIDGMTWGSIANELIYSERHIHRIHASALNNINMS